MTYSDPLEQTEEVDDIKGNNNCPVWMRITAVGMYEIDQRVSIMNGSRNSDKAIKPPKIKESTATKCWIEIDGVIVDVESIKSIPEFVNKSLRSLEYAKAYAVKMKENEAETNGKRWGWYNS